MPNHITTEVEISGPGDKIATLIKKTKIKLDNDTMENKFDFNGIIKMPPELKKTTSPTTVVATEEEAAEKNKADREAAIKNKWSDHTDRYLSQAEHDRRIKKYGANNWYDFANRYWGTKWNAYDVRYMAHTQEKLVLRLQTAWDTPRAIWAKLEELGYTVKGVYYGEMDGFEFIGDGEEVFEAYQQVEVEYVGGE